MPRMQGLPGGLRVFGLAFRVLGTPQLKRVWGLGFRASWVFGGVRVGILVKGSGFGMLGG